MRILVADDQGFWRRALEETLLERGHQVKTAADGEKAWHMLQTEPGIDVLITDYQMPRLRLDFASDTAHFAACSVCTRKPGLSGNTAPGGAAGV